MSNHLIPTRNVVRRGPHKLGSGVSFVPKQADDVLRKGRHWIEQRHPNRTALLHKETMKYMNEITIKSGARYISFVNGQYIK